MESFFLLLILTFGEGGNTLSFDSVHDKFQNRTSCEARLTMTYNGQLKAKGFTLENNAKGYLKATNGAQTWLCDDLRLPLQ